MSGSSMPDVRICAASIGSPKPDSGWPRSPAASRRRCHDEVGRPSRFSRASRSPAPGIGPLPCTSTPRRRTGWRRSGRGARRSDERREQAALVYPRADVPLPADPRALCAAHEPGTVHRHLYALVAAGVRTEDAVCGQPRVRPFAFMVQATATILAASSRSRRWPACAIRCRSRGRGVVGAAAMCGGCAPPEARDLAASPAGHGACSSRRRPPAAAARPAPCSSSTDVAAGAPTRGAMAVEPLCVRCYWVAAERASTEPTSRRDRLPAGHPAPRGTDAEPRTVLRGRLGTPTFLPLPRLIAARRRLLGLPRHLVRVNLGAVSPASC